MSFPWFSIIEDKSLEQGEIIRDCQIPLPSISIYEGVLDGSMKGNVEVKTSDIIILSQSCDIENSKIDSIIVCPIYSLLDLMEVNQYFDSSKARESLRQGKEPAYHLINEFKSFEISQPISVVGFHQIFSIPKEYIEAVALRNSPRLRLLPPYREHLSQAFARYFMRVGLPQNIDRDKIRNIKVVLKK